MAPLSTDWICRMYQKMDEDREDRGLEAIRASTAVWPRPKSNPSKPETVPPKLARKDVRKRKVAGSGKKAKTGKR